MERAATLFISDRSAEPSEATGNSDGVPEGEEHLQSDMRLNPSCAVSETYRARGRARVVM